MSSDPPPGDKPGPAAGVTEPTLPVAQELSEHPGTTQGCPGFPALHPTNWRASQRRHRVPSKIMVPGSVASSLPSPACPESCPIVAAAARRTTPGEHLIAQRDGAIDGGWCVYGVLRSLFEVRWETFRTSDAAARGRKQVVGVPDLLGDLAVKLAAVGDIGGLEFLTRFERQSV